MSSDSNPTHHADTKVEEAPPSASDVALSPLPPTTSSQFTHSLLKLDQTIVDYFGAGSVMGEMGILENKSCNATVECETDVQVRVT